MDFYTRFTNHFRGEKDAIKERLTVYIPLLAPIAARYPWAQVVDLGSGRGEWLELMRDNGWLAKGIDTNESMAQACNDSGLLVEVNDALTALKAEPDSSLAAVTGFHIAEHIPFDGLVELVQEAHRALVPGGVLILETPNPENLTVGLWSFYLDPTHRHPLPPPLLHFVATDSGYARANILRLNGPEPPQEEAPLRNYLDWVVSAYPDYALIAYRACDTQSEPWFNYLDQLSEAQQGSLDTLAAKIEEQTRELERCKSELVDANAAQERLTQEKLDVAQEKLHIEHQLNSVLHSRSWRITLPLRKLMGARRDGPRVTGKLLRRMAQIPWLKRLALKVLNRFPALKLRVLKQMASSDGLFSRAGQLRDEDFQNLEANRIARVRAEAMALRDTVSNVSSLSGIRLEGHINGSYSLASVNRHLVNRLQSSGGMPTIWLVPHESSRETKVSTTPNGQEEVARLNSLTDSTGWQALEPHQRVAVYHHYPLIKPDPTHGKAIALFFWEESWVPGEMVQTLNEHYHGVIVTAWFVKKVLMDSGCQLPVQVIAMPLVSNPLASTSSVDDLKRVSLGQPVNLLHVSSAFPRKGIDVLLQAFEQLAQQDEQITLTLKTFHNPHNQTEALVEKFISSRYRSRLTVIMEDFTAEQMAELYHQADIVVLPTRGEGLNMPAIEAGEFSRALVVTDYGAHTDFTSGNNAGGISYCFDHAQSHFGGNHQAVWVEPGVQSTVEQIKLKVEALRQGGQTAIQTAQELHSTVSARFYSADATASLTAALERLQTMDKACHEQISLSLFSTWREPCGIAQYSDHLVAALKSRDTGMSVEVHTPAELSALASEEVKLVNNGWQRGASPALSGATGNVIWLQHHFAFYELDAALKREVMAARSKGQRVYITLHTTRPVIDFDSARRKAVAATLGEFDRVFVHTLDDLNYLKRIGLTDNLTQMHQGVVGLDNGVPADSQPAAPVIGCFGFLLPHKGVNTLIEAFAALVKRQVLPDTAKLRLVTSVRDEASSQEELARCQRTAQRLGMADNIEWQTSFLPLDEAVQSLASCSMVVLPYQYTQESSSAAVRTAVAACDTVLTTPAPIFDEVVDVVWQSSGFDSHDIAQGINNVLEATAEQRKRIADARRQWLIERQWSTLAERYEALMRSALVDRRFCQELDVNKANISD